MKNKTTVLLLLALLAVLLCAWLSYRPSTATCNRTMPIAAWPCDR